MSLLLAIIQNTPLWVWAILAYIVTMGVRQMREQRLPRTRLLLLPGFWFVFGAWGVSQSFGTGALPLGAWALGLVGGFALVKASGWPGGAAFEPSSGNYRVPGSVLPLLLMLGIFSSKFLLGVSLAMHPELRQVVPVAMSASLLFGAFSGTLLGRSFNVLQSPQSA